MGIFSSSFDLYLLINLEQILFFSAILYIKFQLTDYWKMLTPPQEERNECILAIGSGMLIKSFAKSNYFSVKPRETAFFYLFCDIQLKLFSFL